MTQARLIASLVVSVLCAVAISLGAQHYIHLREAAAQNEQRGRTLESTSGIIAAADTSREEQQRVDTGVREARTNYQRNLEEAKRHEPSIADRADRPLPQRVRDLAHERRLARERSGRAGQRDEEQHAGANAAQR